MASERVARTHGSDVVRFDHAHRGDHEHARRARRAGSWPRGCRRGARRRAGTMACTIAATRVRAPARTLTAVRAIAPVAGMPPNSGGRDVGEALAEELAVGIVFRRVGHAVGDLGREQALERGERGDRERGGEQVAGRAPTDTCGSDGIGNDDGTAPMRATFRCATCATTSRRRRRSATPGALDAAAGATIITATTTATSSTRAHGCRAPTTSADARAPRRRRCCRPSASGTPSADGTCCRKMSVAMPTVNPSMTGHGTNAT